MWDSASAGTCAPCEESTIATAATERATPLTAARIARHAMSNAAAIAATWMEWLRSLSSSIANQAEPETISAAKRGLWARSRAASTLPCTNSRECRAMMRRSANAAKPTAKLFSAPPAACRPPNTSACANRATGSPSNAAAAKARAFEITSGIRPRSSSRPSYVPRCGSATASVRPGNRPGTATLSCRHRRAPASYPWVRDR